MSAVNSIPETSMVYMGISITVSFLFSAII